jgi:hypothetical protein
LFGRRLEASQVGLADETAAAASQGQHLELGIAEMNLFTMLSALGLSHAINGETWERCTTRSSSAAWMR